MLRVRQSVLVARSRVMPLHFSVESDHRTSFARHSLGAVIGMDATSAKIVEVVNASNVASMLLVRQ